MQKLSGVILFLAFLIGLAISCHGVDKEIEEDLPLSLSYFRNKPYYIETYKKYSHNNAVNFCLNLGMQLIAIDDCEENSFISLELKKLPELAKRNYWIAASLRGDQWEWDNRQPLNFTNWKYTEPSGGKDEICVEIQEKYLQWNDVKCVKKNYFICEGN